MALSDSPEFGSIDVSPFWKVAVVRSSWHSALNVAMSTDCVRTLIESGIPAENIQEIVAPGSFEVPLFVRSALTTLGFDAAVAFGIVLQGATHHADLVAHATANACMQIQLELLKPVTYEILYVNTLEDAKARASGKNGKGILAAKTVLSCLATQAGLRR